MKKTFILCYMMMSCDGRIDCPMTEHLPGTEDYYPTLDALNCPTHVSGRETSRLEIASGEFTDFSGKEIQKECFHKAEDSQGYEVIVDTKGTLRYDNNPDAILVLTSEKADVSYLSYLEKNGISYIVTGKDKVDLKRSCEILSEEFHVRRMAVVGGGHINAGFLNAGLLDEVDLMIGSGIDGREKMASVFDGLSQDTPLHKLKRKEVKLFDSEAVLIRYDVL